jgi:hypothetical protein
MLTAPSRTPSSGRLARRRGVGRSDNDQRHRRATPTRTGWAAILRSVRGRAFAGERRDAGAEISRQPLLGISHAREKSVTSSVDRWVARLTPAPGTSIESLLVVPLGLDVWERHPDVLVVAASEIQLSELERRRLAKVERLTTVAEFEAQARRGPTREQEGSTG